jgi:Ribosome recycling factor
MLKSKEISEDDEKKFEKVVQQSTDNHIKKIDEKIISKEEEIMKI